MGKILKKLFTETSPKTKIKNERKDRNNRNNSAVQKQYDNGKNWNKK